MSDIIEATRLIDEAVALGLSGADRYATYPTATLAERWNGIGPETAPSWMRMVLTKWLKIFLAACFIHDQRFAESDGTDRGFREANDELERNCLIIADNRYAWYNPLRYLARKGGEKVADACRVGGWDAWMNAYRARPSVKEFFNTTKTNKE